MAGRALVTGLSGFTGSYMARELEALGYRVYGLGQTGQSSGDNIVVDLRDAQGVKSAVASIQPDLVVHLAAVAFVAHGDVADIYSSNIVGTRNLLSALSLCDRAPHKVLLASSANVYGNVSASLLIDEDCTLQPENDYAVSKCAMEMVAHCWRDKLPIIIARPFNYTGVGQSLSFLLPKLVDHFARGLARVELGNIDVYRDFSDVRVVTNAYARLLSLGEPGQVYNVCSGHVYAIRQVLDILAELAGYAIDVQINPEFVRVNEVKHLAGSNQRLVRAIGELESIPLANTLEWMYQTKTAR